MARQGEGEGGRARRIGFQRGGRRGRDPPAAVRGTRCLYRVAARDQHHRPGLGGGQRQTPRRGEIEQRLFPMQFDQYRRNRSVPHRIEPGAQYRPAIG